MHRFLQFLNSNLTLPQTKHLHAAIIASGLSQQPYPTLKLLRAYAIHKDLTTARHLFDEIPHRNIYLWNSMIRAYARDHDFRNAFCLFSLMQISDAKPDGHTFACILRACAERQDHAGAKMVHGSMILSGLQSDPVGSSAVVSAYSKVGLVDAAATVFNQIPDPDLVLYNSMISGYGYDGFWQKGLEMLHRMQVSGRRPDGYSLVGVMSCFKYPGLLPICRGVHGFCLKGGFDSTDHVRSMLLSMYSRCHCLDSVFQVFRSLSQPDLVTWSAMISGLSQAGRCEDALAFFSEMHALGETPDAVLVATLLTACASLAAVEPGKEIHCYAFQLGLDVDVSVSCSLIDMYTKCGFGQLGLQIFESMPRRTLTAYNIVILGLGSHGMTQRAIVFFDDMLSERLNPDKATFSALLCACCHSVLVNEAWDFFRRMQDEFRIEAQMEHYVYMVRLLGMVGELQEAYNLIQNMPIMPDSGVWGALLWGCNVHGNLELGKLVANQLILTEPEKTAYRVMLSNIYAAEHKWDDVESLRDGIAEEGARKLPGHSWIGDDNIWNRNSQFYM